MTLIVFVMQSRKLQMTKKPTKSLLTVYYSGCANSWMLKASGLQWSWVAPEPLPVCLCFPGGVAAAS